MIKIIGKVLNSKTQEKTNDKNETKITTLLNLVNEKYENIYLTVQGSTTEFDGKFIAANCIGKDTFYNVIDEEIKIIEDREDIRTILNNIIDNVKIIDVLENQKDKIKTLVILNQNNKVMKIKAKNTEKNRLEQIKEMLLNKTVNVENVLTYTDKETRKTYYRVENLKSAIKVVK